LGEIGVDRLVAELLSDGFGYAKINNFGPVMRGDDDVGRLDVAVDDAFLVGVLDGGTNLAEEFETGAGREAGFGRSSR
jgi:hypothetical protein